MTYSKVDNEKTTSSEATTVLHNTDKYKDNGQERKNLVIYKQMK